MHFFPLAMGTAFGQEMRPVTKINQGLEPSRDLNNNRTAPTTITTVRPAFRNKLFPTEAGTAIAAVSGLDEEFGFIYKSHFYRRLVKSAEPEPVSGSSLNRIHTYPFAFPAKLFIGDNPVNFSKQCIIAT
jgi:hypothetical protein